LNKNYEKSILDQEKDLKQRCFKEKEDLKLDLTEKCSREHDELEREMQQRHQNELVKHTDNLTAENEDASEKFQQSLVR
jgi:hypothetical protein